MVAPVKSGEPYSLDPVFEAAVVTVACCRPRFYGRIGYALETDLLSAEPAKLALKAAHAINAVAGHGPGSTIIVIQRLRQWMTEGKNTLEAIHEVSEMFDAAEDKGLPSEDELVAELKPMLSRRMQTEAVRAASAEYAKRGDFSSVVEVFEKAKRIGDTDTSVGTVLGEGSFRDIEELKHLSRLETGVVELDAALGGGLQLGGLGVVIGGSGDGKSMFMSQQAAVSTLGGLHVGYATLELPKPIISARIKAALLGVPIDALTGGGGIPKARERLAGMSLGRCVVQYFTAGTTTVQDIIEWVKKCEENAGGRKMDLLVVDYGDKLIAPKVGSKETGEYTTGKVVFEGLRVYAEERKLWCWTGSQASRTRDKKNKRLGLDDVSDSMHKVRVADLVITLNIRDEGEQMLFFVAKHRTGKSNVQVGPLPHDFQCGRVAPLNIPDGTAA